MSKFLKNFSSSQQRDSYSSKEYNSNTKARGTSGSNIANFFKKKDSKSDLSDLLSSKIKLNL